MESILNIIFAFMIGFMLCYIYRHNSNHNVVYKEDKEDKKDKIKKKQKNSIPKKYTKHLYFDPLSKENIIMTERAKKVLKGKTENINEKDNIVLVKIDEDKYYFSSLYYVGMLFNEQQGTIKSKLLKNEKMMTSDGKEIKIYYILKDKLNNDDINSFKPCTNNDKLYIKTNIDKVHSNKSSKYKLIYNGTIYYCNTYAEIASITKVNVNNVISIYKKKVDVDNIKIYLNEEQK